MRKLKEQLYQLEKIDNKYIIKFINSKNIIQKIEVSEQLYFQFHKFELEEISQLHKFERHIEHY